MRTLLILLLSAFVSACSTMADLQPGSGGTVLDVRARSYDAIWNASVRAMSQEGLTIVESDKATGTIKSESSVGVFSWGEVVGLFILPAKPGSRRYTVEVVSRKRAQYQIADKNHEPVVIEAVRAGLRL